MAGVEWWAGLPLVAGEESGAGLSVPGAVGVPGQAAVGTVSSVQLAALQRHLGYAHLAGHKQLLLHTTEEEKKKMKSVTITDMKPKKSLTQTDRRTGTDGQTDTDVPSWWTT